MPYRWSEQPAAAHLTLWPHQSLSPTGFVVFIGATAAMLALPLIATLGSSVHWWLLTFLLAALVAIWAAIIRNRRDLSTREDLHLTADGLHLTHKAPREPQREWHAKPHWTRAHLRHDGPVENYLTLTGGGREVELGAFLTPEERARLHSELTDRLRRFR